MALQRFAQPKSFYAIKLSGENYIGQLQPPYKVGELFGNQGFWVGKTKWAKSMKIMKTSLNIVLYPKPRCSFIPYLGDDKLHTGGMGGRAPT